MTKFYIKITLIVLLFAGCITAGYFIMPESLIKVDKGIGGGSVAVITENEVSNIPSEAGRNSELEIEEIQPDTLSSKRDSLETELPSLPKDTLSSQGALSSQPRITHVWVRPLKETPARESHKIGKKVVITAKTESNDPLKYKIVTSAGKEYTSANGVFGDVLPTDDGKFTVIVTNPRTGHEDIKECNKLNKNNRLPAKNIEQQLSSGILDKHFYFYFMKEVKFRCFGTAIPEGDEPKTLSELVNVASMGYTIDVKDNTIKYNEWNRITYFEIELN